MSENAIALRPKQVMEKDIEPLSAAEIVLLQGDLSILTASQRVEYYAKVCESVGLNPLTKPFEYIILNGKLTLYTKKDATDQLRDIKGISVTKMEREQTTDTYDVYAYGRTKDGREDSSLGSVPITNLKGEALSNAKMKAETKAKRRLTLSLAGLGWLDEAEVSSIASAQPVVVTDEGVVIVEPTERPTLAAVVAERVAATLAFSADSDDDPEPPAGSGTVLEAPGSGEGKEEAPEKLDEPVEPVAAVEPVEDLTAEAAEVFADVAAPGITMDEFKRMMREKHVLSGQVTAIAKRKLAYTGMVAEMSDADRYRLWEAVMDDLNT